MIGFIVDVAGVLLALWIWEKYTKWKEHKRYHG